MCLTATGLVVIGTIGYDLFTNKVANWQNYAKRLADIDWRRSAPIWQGNIVLANGKMALGQSAVKGAILNACKAIGWERPSSVRSKSSAEDSPDAGNSIQLAAFAPSEETSGILEIAE